jgi:hypothetical protein
MFLLKKLKKLFGHLKISKVDVFHFSLFSIFTTLLFTGLPNLKMDLLSDTKHNLLFKVEKRCFKISSPSGIDSQILWKLKENGNTEK